MKSFYFCLNFIICEVFVLSVVSKFVEAKVVWCC
jgi:hypothetical protein